MSQKTRFFQTIAAAVLVGALELTGALTIGLSLTDPAAAQFQRRGGFFDSLFGPRRFGPMERDIPTQQPVESSRAPAPKKNDVTPTMSVMVMGDSMADWLGFGLEEAFADSPEIAILRRSKLHSGLLRYEARSDLDWWHVARDLLAKDKVDFVVMMLGLDDRQSIRESQVEKEKEKDKKNQGAAKDAAKETAKDASKDGKNDDEEETPAIVAPEPKRSASSGTIEFRTERWEQIYTKRIDDTIAALKSKGVPVLWVGLPSIRGTRSTADAVYLNDLYRARAEHAGIVYVDVWDGFVDEGGKFTYMGPDFEGQNRRLRSGDGVHFTKNGARKLAHYVERELRRFMSNRALPMAMPSGPQAPVSTEPTARPVAGPVVPLTGAPAGGEELLGGGATRPVHSDPVATRVLVKGEPVAAAPGRADDFRWPRGSDAASAEPLSPTAAAARAEPAPSPKTPPKPEATQAAREPAKSPDPRPKPAEKPAAAKPASQTASGQGQMRQPAPQQQQPPRPQQPVQQQQPRQSGGLFGLFR